MQVARQVLEIGNVVQLGRDVPFLRRPASRKGRLAGFKNQEWRNPHAQEGLRR